MMSPMNEKDWRAQSDANTLAEAKVIADDQGRLRAAKMAAQRMADEQREKADAMAKVASQPKVAGNSGTRQPTMHPHDSMPWPVARH